MSELINKITSLEKKKLELEDKISGILNMFTPESKSLVLSDAGEKKLAKLSDEVKTVNEELVNLRAEQTAKKDKARRIKVKDLASGSKALAGDWLRETPLDPGISFARYVRSIAIGNGSLPQALEIARADYGEDSNIVANLKAAVAAGTTTHPTWAAPLVEDYQTITNDFIEYLRPRTILGQFGYNGVPSLRKIPFNVRIPTQVSGGEGYWVGQGQAKPLTKFDFGEVKLGFAKVANICVVTDELLRWAVPQTEEILRDQLAQALIERLDKDFIDPAKTLVPNVSPASITNGVTPLTPSSIVAENNIEIDVKAMISNFIASNQSVKDAVFIMSATRALSLSLLTNPLGQRVYPELEVDGGTFYGIKTITSQYVPSDTVILVNASEIYLADDGFVSVTSSDQASLEMRTDPTHYSAVVPDYTPDHGPSFGTSLVSLWQTNSVGIRAERYINWTKRRPQSVSIITGVTWGNYYG